jgi:hypothetical protein
MRGGTPDEEMTMVGLTILFADIPEDLHEELIQTLLGTPSVRIQRIISLDYSSPEGFRHDQESHEELLSLTLYRSLLYNGRRWIRTSDFHRVRMAL